MIGLEEVNKKYELSENTKNDDIETGLEMKDDNPRN